MSSRFSGALQLTNLDDFINPSNECIKPVKIQKNETKTGAKIKIQDDGSYTELDEKDSSKSLSKVDIALADCLACSGCITSAESVLVTQQSKEEMLRIFNENSILKQQGKNEEKYIIVSLSIQPILSIAQYYELEPYEAAKKLCGYFKKLGADLVLDMTIADDIALFELAKEFCTRYKKSKIGHTDGIPMLTSSCPGWVCYAEKTHGNFILPYISNTASPQQIMGTIIKRYLAKKLSTDPAKIYHITLMPCYDKKLEASRQDFYDELIKSKTVDCVMTSIEMQQLLEEQQITLSHIESSEIDRPFGVYKEPEETLYSHEGSGSGGYADYVLHFIAKNLFNQTDVKPEYKCHRNPDFRETILKIDEKVSLKFAIINGFRNIQNIVQKIKRKKCDYDFIEIMACPAGCLNGGAQIKPRDKVLPRELALKLENIYNNMPKISPETNKAMKEICMDQQWIGHEDKILDLSIFQTQYHEVQKMNTALTIKW